MTAKESNKMFHRALVNISDALLVTIKEEGLDIDEVKATLQTWIKFGMEGG